MTRAFAGNRLLAANGPLAFPGQRIGIMGGSFNPPHAGHLMVAETALRRLRLDAVWWLVSPGNPLKDHNGLLSLDARMAACEHFCTSPRMFVTALEADLTTTFTVDTLTVLKARYPGVELVWVMGGDNLYTFHHWSGWRKIAQLMPIAVVDRPGFHFKALAAPAARRLNRARIPEALAGSLSSRQTPAWVYLTTRLSDLSSSQIRAEDNPYARLSKGYRSYAALVKGIAGKANRAYSLFRAKR